MVLHKVYNHVIDKAMSSEENDRVVNKSYINNLIKEINQNLITKIKAHDTDKQHRVFASQDDAITFGNTLGIKLYKRITSDAPKELQKDGKNLSSNELFNRMWGINANNRARMIPTNDEKWCVYWRPSLLEIVN